MDKEFILGTLGNNTDYLTCSMYVGNKRYINSIIRGYPTYEAALPDLKSKKISVLLVPAAYPKINNFIMDDELLAQEVFIEPIPPLVLIKKNIYCNLKQITRIYLHPATSKLLDEVIPQNNTTEVIFVDSNIMACERLMKDNNDNIMAITNILCANYFDLPIERVLRKSVKMPWVLFKKL